MIKAQSYQILSFSLTVTLTLNSYAWLLKILVKGTSPVVQWLRLQVQSLGRELRFHMSHSVVKKKIRVEEMSCVSQSWSKGMFTIFPWGKKKISFILSTYILLLEFSFLVPVYSNYIPLPTEDNVIDWMFVYAPPSPDLQVEAWIPVVIVFGGRLGGNEVRWRDAIMMRLEPG